MLSILLFAAAAGQATDQPPEFGIDAPTPNMWQGIQYFPTLYTQGDDRAFRRRMLAFREEALQQQALDGGTLTAEHRAELQRKLNRIHFRYAERRRRADILAVDSNGRAVYSAATRPTFVQPPGLRLTRVAN